MLFENKGDSISIRHTSTFTFPHHLHTHIEIIICKEGTFEVSCNEQIKILHKGDVMICFPNDIHSYKKTESGEGIIIIFPSNISEQITSALNSGEYENFIHNKDVILLADDLCVQFNSSSNPYIIFGYLHIIFGMLLKKKEHQKHQVNINTFNAAIKYISLNYTKPITLKQVSKYTGVSQCHLSRLFSDKIDGGFKNYLKILRVEKAKNLLRTTDLSIYEVLMDSGFSDQRTFNRIFKSVTNKTPSEYKKALYTKTDMRN